MNNTQFRDTGNRFQQLFKELSIQQIVKEVFEEFHVDDQGLITRFVIGRWEEEKAKNKGLKEDANL